MSAGNLKDNGNKGNNFPYQLGVLKLLGAGTMGGLLEVTITNATSGGLTTAINAYFVANPTKILVSKQIVFDGVNHIAYLSVGSI